MGLEIPRSSPDADKKLPEPAPFPFIKFVNKKEFVRYKEANLVQGNPGHKGAPDAVHTLKVLALDYFVEDENAGIRFSSSTK